MIQSKVNTETRGRPRKEETRTLSPIYKTIFSDNSAIIHTSFLIYVFEVFVDTKNEKRVGHKDGGFTIYDRIDSQYCFDNIEEELLQWQCNAIAKTQKMKDFMKLLPALGPKIILKQICRLINSIVEWYSSGLSEDLIFTELTHPNNQQRLNELYPYMRFVPLALHQLKIDRNQRSDRSNSLQDLVKQRVNYLWEHLQKIIIHTIFNCIEGNMHNKYFKPFFSDAENPSETHIGQLNLDQVVRVVRKQENNQKSNRRSEYNIQEQNIDKLRKMRSMVDSDGTRTVVHVIKAPEVINFHKSTSQSIGVSFGGPLKTTITDKIWMGKQKVQNQDEEKIKKELSEINAGLFKSSSWKPAGKQQHRLFSPPLVNSQLKSAIKDDIKKQQNIENKQFNSSFKELELKSQEYQLSLGNSSEFKKEEREKNNSKKKNGTTNNNAVLYSAALQDHFMKKNNYDLQEPKFTSFKNIRISDKLPAIKPMKETIISRAQMEIKRLTDKQKGSILPYESQTLKKIKQTKSDEEKMMKYNKKLTWAQKLGIVQKPPLPLTAKDWAEIEQKSKKRNDSQNVCSICLQNFKIQPQVILSCSHVFHHKCLASFENHNKVHCCPICRKKNYQKKVIDQAIRVFTMKSILRLQRVYRGSRDRIRIYGSLVDNNYVCKSKLFNRRLIGFKMWRLSSKITEKMKKDLQHFQKMMKQIQNKHKIETEMIFQEIVSIQREKILNEGAIDQYLRKIGVQRDQKPSLKHNTHNWEQIMKKGAQRAGDDEQCSICLMALWSKPVYLLSCTHTFHVNCIEGFERYSLPGCKNKCPCCRSQYEKKVVQKHK